MKTVIYPDKDTDLSKYEHINSEIIVYDKTGSINTTFKKTDSDDVFSSVECVILTQNCIKEGSYDIKPLEEVCTKLSDKIRGDALIVFDTLVPPRTVFKMSKVIDEYGLMPELNIAYTCLI